MDNVIVEIKNMTKTFGQITALNDVSIQAHAGKILGLIGENGSGKSTITSIYAGLQKADKGEMFFKGNKWEPTSMVNALENGVGMIVQENGTVPGISVAENIFLGKIDEFSKGPFTNKKKMIQAANAALEAINANHINAAAITGSLDFQDRKLIEIAKVMVKKPEVLIVDETTTALSQKGRDIIYSLMNKMKDENKSVIFISHGLDEIMEKCDELTVLRDGRIIRTFTKDEFDPNLIKSSMIGREIKGDYYRTDFDGPLTDEVVFDVSHVYLNTHLQDINIKVNKGEILGIGGLSHCGMHSLGKVLFGAIKNTSGSITFKGKKYKNEAEAMKLGIGYVAKDRDTESLCLDASIKDNISIAGMDKFAVAKFLLLPNKETAYVRKQIDSLKIKCPNENTYVSTLSGGNKQKVVFGKWVGRDSDLLILDCPTRGVDIGVKQAMYQLINQMKLEGKSIILISEEMAELIGMSDNLIIMKDGKIANKFKRSQELSESMIIEYMI